MKTKEILKNSKLIADFLGLKTVTEEKFLNWDYPNGEEYAKTNSHPKNMFVLESFDFHADWNSLMVLALRIAKEHGVDCIAKRYSMKEIYDAVIKFIKNHTNTCEGTKIEE